MPAPRDVRLIRPDGTEVPLELIYVGRDADGVHQWRAVTAAFQPGDRLTAALIPPQTAIAIEVRR